MVVAQYGREATWIDYWLEVKLKGALLLLMSVPLPPAYRRIVLFSVFCTRPRQPLTIKDALLTRYIVQYVFGSSATEITLVVH